MCHIYHYGDQEYFFSMQFYRTKPFQSRIHISSRIIIKIESSFRIQLLIVVLVRLLAGCRTLSKRHTERIIIMSLNNTIAQSKIVLYKNLKGKLSKVICFKQWIYIQYSNSNDEELKILNTKNMNRKIIQKQSNTVSKVFLSSFIFSTLLLLTTLVFAT